MLHRHLTKQELWPCQTYETNTSLLQKVWNKPNQTNSPFLCCQSPPHCERRGVTCAHLKKKDALPARSHLRFTDLTSKKLKIAANMPEARDTYGERDTQPMFWTLRLRRAENAHNLTLGPYLKPPPFGLKQPITGYELCEQRYSNVHGGAALKFLAEIFFVCVQRKVPILAKAVRRHDAKRILAWPTT